MATSVPDEAARIVAATLRPFYERLRNLGTQRGTRLRDGVRTIADDMCALLHTLERGGGNA